MKRIYKFCLWIMAVAVPVAIAACYGMAYRYKNGKVIDSTSKKGIGNIQITCIEGTDETAQFHSYENGGFSIQYDPPCDRLRFEDVDGEDNGGIYQTQTIDFDPDSQQDLTVELEH